MVDESTLNLTVKLHGTTQTRCIACPRSPTTPLEPSTTSLAIASVPSQLFDTKVAQNPTPNTLGRKQDLTSTNQNTRSRTRQHPISCILVPHHDRAHGNHSRRIKPPNHQIFTVLDPFYPRHFAFPFGLPAVPYRRGRPNVQRWISPTTHPLNISSRVHTSSHATTTTTPRGQYRL